MLEAAWSAEGIAGLPLCTFEDRAPLSCTTLPGRSELSGEVAGLCVTTNFACGEE
jgi:hypothetical protein